MRAMPTMPAMEATLIWTDALGWTVHRTGRGDTYDMSRVLFDHFGEERLQRPEMGESVHTECSMSP